MLNKNKLYILPMKFVCNAKCSWCLSKQNNPSSIREKLELDEMFLDNFKKSYDFLKTLPITKLEFTGGGEPFLNKNLNDIIIFIQQYFPDAYSKLYTNGFLLKPVVSVSEINISRSHWDDSINKSIYKSSLQNNLKETISFFKQFCTKIRTCTVLEKGAIDSEAKALEMINLLPEVDQFVFRPMNKEARLSSYVDFDISHPKALKDEIDCTCHKSLVLAPNGKLYYDFNLSEEILLPN